MIRYVSILAKSGLLSLLALPLVGCGSGGDERAAVYPVKGKVTLAGAPIPNASVIFSPVGDEKGKTRPTATGMTNGQGEFTLSTYDAGDGAAAGEYTVLISKSGGSQEASPESAHEEFMKGGGAPGGHSQSGSGGGANSTLPARYASPDSSDLKATVTTNSDENTFDFKLTP